MNSVTELLESNYILWLILLTTVIYFCTTYNSNFWASRNVKYYPPVPIFGNSFKTALSISANSHHQQHIYNYFSGLPYGGTWSYFRPKLMIRDPKLLEHILIKDFSTFINRERTADSELDPLTKHLVHVTGNTWKALRSKLTPVFTSGKLKTMLPQIIACSDVFIDYLTNQHSAGPIEVRETMAGFTMDVIGSCAFGLSLEDVRDSNSPFRQIGRNAFGESRITKLRSTLRSGMLSFLRFLRWKAIPKKLENFFVDTVKNTIQYRQENNIHRADFIQLMMEVRKEEERNIKEGTAKELIMDDKTMTANAFVFLLAGFETTAATISYALYELSVNPDIQQKVYNEAIQILRKHEGNLSWEALKEMTYIEQVVLETFRKYPPVVEINRQSVKPYKIPNSNLELQTGSVITVPIYAIQHDPQYFPEPEKFDPERFSEINKEDIVKCTFLAFGDGPRICIGLRFAKVEIKVAIVKFILNYKFSLNYKTISPLQHSTQTTFLTPKGGILLDFKQRT